MDPEIENSRLFSSRRPIGSGFGKLVAIVAKKTKKPFTSHTHQQAIRYYKVRPRHGAPQPENTDKTYCIYHAAHGDYTYSEQWVEKLVSTANDPDELAKIKAVKLQ